MRGPVAVTADLSNAGTPFNLAGAIMAPKGQILGRKLPTGGQIDPWNVPLLLPTAVTDLATSESPPQYVVGSDVIALSYNDGDHVPGPRWINFEGLLYGISYDSAGAAVSGGNNSYQMKPLSLCTCSMPEFSDASGFSAFVTSDTSNGGVGWSVTTGFPASVTLRNTAPKSGILDMSIFGLAVPAGATITGVEFKVTRYSDAPQTITESSYQLYSGGGAIGTAKGGEIMPSTAEMITLGGPSDLWGAALTPAIVNSIGLGLVCEVNGNLGTAHVTGAQVTVYYMLSEPAITPLTAAPHGAFDLIGYQSRIWLLGGIDTPGAGTTHSPTTLFFTNPITEGGGSASADWKDPVDGTTNQIVMDGDTSDYGVGLATVRNGLVILRRSSLYLLRGTTTANYTLSPISQETGCVDARSIVETDAGVYFMSQHGLMLTNGTTVANVSGTVLHTLQQAVAAEQAAVLDGSGGYVTCGRTSQGHIVISIGIGASGAAPGPGSYSPIFAAMFDPSAVRGGAWVRLTSQVWENDGTQQSGNNYPGQVYFYGAPLRLITIGDQYVTALEDPSVNSTMLDYTAGIYDVLPSGSDPYMSIPAVWRPPVASITTAAKRTFAQAKRYYLDYQFSASGLVPAVGWTVQPFDAAGNSLQDAQDAPVGIDPPSLTGWVSGVTPVPGEFIQRLNCPFWGELGDFTFLVQWADAARAAQAGSSVVEIYGLGMEFQHARDRI